MPTTSLWESALLFVASAAAGAVNSVAGGGTLLTFPALLAAGYLHKAANATSTVALWPGQASSLWGLRREVKESLRGRMDSVWQLLAIGGAGGIVGAVLFTRTGETAFRLLVPYLILLSVLLFLVQEPLSRRLKAREADGDTPTGDTLQLSFPVALFLFGIAVYGGYFGAGIGILTLAALGMLGMRDIHRMNGVKAVFTLAVNGVTALLFSLGGLVNWRTAGLMAIASLIGGYAGAGIARRMGQKNVRRVVVFIGLSLAVKLLWDAYGMWFLRVSQTLFPA
ncbi:MAG: sulfite exporter TauE/SafE family protein [Akkermansiaceae bacterium]|nr:sulfite exporter TauE/SafE family protein [Armatimonadota bacterium]